MDNSFAVDIPWIIGDGEKITFDIRDKRLLGSKKHFIRFDLYPLYAPLHLKRHHGFWDLPLEQVVRKRIRLSFRQGELWMKRGWRAVPIKPVWKGSLDFVGYSMLHISLWDFSLKPPVQLTVKSSQHVLRRGGRDLPLEQVFLPVTQHCNLRCPMCMRHNPDDWESTDIPEEVLKAVFEASPSLHSVFVFGIGEPLLYPKLFEVVAGLKKSMPEDSYVGFTTNGTLMTERTSARLVDLGVDWICFSVDGATKPTYEIIRPGADFDEVIKNIAYTVRLRSVSGQKKPWLVTNFVMQEKNVREIPSFVRLAASLGLDTITFSHLRDFKVGEFRMCDKALLVPLLEEASRIGERRGVQVTLPRLHPLNKPRCLFMQSAYLWLSGEVVPCCRMLKGAYPGPIRAFGNVKDKPLLDIWNSPEYREFRHGVLTGDFPDECKGCNYAVGLLN